MRSTNTFGVHFIIRLNKEKYGRAPIYARLSVNNKRCEIAIKQWIDVSDWNDAKGLAKPKTDELKRLNSLLEQTRSRLGEHYQDILNSHRIPTIEAIKREYMGLAKQEYTLCALVKYHNTHNDQILTPGTLKNYFTTEKYIQSFLKTEYKVTDIYLSEMGYQFIAEFELFLRKYKPVDHQKKMSNNGVMKHLERFKKIIKQAVRMQWLDRNPFELYQLKFRRVERGYLTVEELGAIEKKKLSITRLDWIRDLFIFSCYTGLSYIDVMQLSPADIIIGVDKLQWIKKSRQKTNTPITVPLLQKAQDIIKKYEQDPRAIFRGAIFPAISNQKLNSYLKDLADSCGISKNLTFHLARHTFATTVTLSNGVPMETVSKLLGHTKMSTTQIYSKVVEHKISQDMELLSKKLDGRKDK